MLAQDGLALLLGMLLDQQFPMERAFFGPYLLTQRMGRDLDAAVIAEYPEEELAAIFRGPPVIHRYPAAMAKRTQEVCRTVRDSYDANAEAIWTTASSGPELLARLKALPGFGDAKSRIFVGILGKRLGAASPGWEEVAADWPSIADVAVWEDVLVVREQKRLMKAKGRT
ncbi:MAG: HhH-GPD-type base excision DNA repair protein [Acidimicrobiia bacterium]